MKLLSFFWKWPLPIFGLVCLIATPWLLHCYRLDLDGLFSEALSPVELYNYQDIASIDYRFPSPDDSKAILLMRLSIIAEDGTRIEENLGIWIGSTKNEPKTRDQILSAMALNLSGEIFHPYGENFPLEKSWEKLLNTGTYKFSWASNELAVIEYCNAGISGSNSVRIYEPYKEFETDLEIAEIFYVNIQRSEECKPTKAMTNN